VFFYGSRPTVSGTFSIGNAASGGSAGDGNGTAPTGVRQNTN
jgi:hypothetical protein